MNGDVTLAYLTRGLSWNADYVAVFDEAAGNVSMQGWITLTNNSGTTFANANAQLVAGDVNVVGSEAEWLQIYNIRRNHRTCYAPAVSRRRVASSSPTTTCIRWPRRRRSPTTRRSK